MAAADRGDRPAPEPIGARARVSNAGRALAVLVLAAVLAAGVVALGLFGVGPRRGAATGRGAGDGAPAIEAPIRLAPVEQPAPPPVPPAPAREEPRTAVAAPRAPRSGPTSVPATARGNLRVVVVLEDGRPAGEACVVEIGPTDFLVGEGRGESRSERIPAGEDRATFWGLPVGAYAVSARVEGRLAAAAHVLVSSQVPDPLVRLVLRRTSFVDGTILDAAGAPVEGVLVSVHLEVEEPGRVRAESRSDAAGGYRIEGVVPGVYVLRVGPKEAPYLPPLRIQIAGESPLRHDVRLPLLGTLEVRVMDEGGRPLPEAVVEGYGPPGGTFHRRTDPSGACSASTLPVGRYRVHVRAGGFAPVFLEATVRAGERSEETVSLRAAPR